MKKGLDRLKKRNTRKKGRRKKILVFAVIILLIVFLFNFIDNIFNTGTVSVRIKEGTSSYKIAEILKDEGVINSKMWFMFRLSLSGKLGKLQHGTFKFDKNDSVSEIIEILTTKGAKKNTVTLTIPEGYSIERIKARVVEMGLCTDNEFENALKKDYDYPFLKSIPDSGDIKYRLQGFLYPSTYEFYADATAETVVKTLLDEFKKQTEGLGIPDGKMYEIVTKASMVEREAKIEAERRVIAGVFENRIKADMPLQIDATVVYTISDGMYDVERVYFRDLEVDSKYNTYKYKGLPAGPICSPGLSSIKAAQNPQIHNFLYYHTDTSKNDGTHIFTENYNEHTSTQN